MFPLNPIGENPPSILPSLWELARNPWLPLACCGSSSISASDWQPVMTLLFLQGHQSPAHCPPGWPHPLSHLNHILKDYFQVGSHSQVPGLRTSIYPFERPNSTHNRVKSQGRWVASRIWKRLRNTFFPRTSRKEHSPANNQFNLLKILGLSSALQISQIINLHCLSC